MDVVHDDAGHRFSTGEDLCQLDFNGVDAGHVMHDDADTAAIVWYWRSPFVIGEGRGEGRESAGAGFETIGQRMRLLARGSRRCLDLK
jgi:hypothetical protein